MGRDNQEVTIVIFTKNEERNGRDIIRRVSPYADRVVVIDGHSTDNTRKIAEEEGVEVRLDPGGGKGAAIRYAIDKIETDIFIFIDADGSHDPADIPRLIRPILEGRAEMAVASRMRGGSDELYGTVEQFFRLVGSQIITLAINYRFNVRLTDSQNGFRAIKAQAAKNLNLKEDLTTIEQEMTIDCLKKKFRIEEIASHEYARKFGRSNITVWKVAYRYVWCLLKNII